MGVHYFIYSAVVVVAQHLGWGWWSLLAAVAAMPISFAVEGAYLGIRDGLRYRRSLR